MSEARARKKVALPRFGGSNGGSDDAAARFAEPLLPIGAVTGPPPATGAHRPTPAAVPTAAPPQVRTELAGAAFDRDRDLAALQADRPRSIAISTRLMAHVADAAAGVFLSQLVFWSRYGSEVVERDGWVFKTAQDWERETSLSWKTQRRARTLLLRLGLIEERRLNMPARMEFRLSLATVIASLDPRLSIGPQGSTVDWRAWQSPMPDGTPGVAEALLGRCFLFHAALAEPLTLTGAMMCSRLLAGVRWNGQGPFIPAGIGNVAFSRFVGLSRSKWRQETGLSRDQWQTARNRLRAFGVLAERLANYPRRVDLAINLSALSALLKDAAAKARQAGPVEEKRGWAKQPPSPPVSPNPAFKDHPIPPTESPDPADRDRPNLPPATAQSRLYPSVSQAMTPPPPRERVHEGSAVTRPAADLGRGGGGLVSRGQPEVVIGRGDSEQGRVPATLPPEAVQRQAAVAQGELHWPAGFTPSDREHAARHLAGLAPPAQQAVLDEVQWAHQSSAVRSPVGLTRSLAGKVRAGTFAPDGAHRVAEARAAREAHQQREAAPRPAAQPQPHQPRERSPEEEARYQANRERLKQVTEALRRRAG
ncbi:MAG: hypothetical protein KIT17_01110 [Rubrivivax sp.]|nr:hypothetical protein [Rubrivivax sp.]